MDVLELKPPAWKVSFPIWILYDILQVLSVSVIIQNFVKVAPATSIVPMVVTDAKTPFVNAR